MIKKYIKKKTGLDLYEFGPGNKKAEQMMTLHYYLTIEKEDIREPYPYTVSFNEVYAKYLSQQKTDFFKTAEELAAALAEV